MSAVKIMPESLVDDYTLNGRIKIVDWWFDNTKNNSTSFYSQDIIENNIALVKNGGIIRTSYQQTDPLLYQALEKYKISGGNILIVGSEQPSYECICLAYGANPTIVDYNKIHTDHKKLKTYTVQEHEKLNPTYDFIVSVSSLEHDGLGRYGDPLNPYADFEAMDNMRKYLKKDGLLFLAVPVGSDVLFWNAARWYGSIRFPMLIEKWDLIDAFGFYTMMLCEQYTPGAPYNQPVFVLRKKEV